MAATSTWKSTGFVALGFGPGSAAYLADRYSRGNRHPGTNSILRLPGADLVKAGVRPGDLLAATEASARTIVVRCTQACAVRYIAIGSQVTHAEGHITFTRAAGLPLAARSGPVALRRWCRMPP
jgi:hypothetical protein